MLSVPTSAVTSRSPGARNQSAAGVPRPLRHSRARSFGSEPLRARGKRIRYLCACSSLRNSAASPVTIHGIIVYPDGQARHDRAVRY
jgi:hypothetical protein